MAEKREVWEDYFPKLFSDYTISVDFPHDGQQFTKDDIRKAIKNAENNKPVGNHGIDGIKLIKHDILRKLFNEFYNTGVYADAWLK